MPDKRMRKQVLWRGVTFALLLVAIISGSTNTVLAETSSSPNYLMTESEFSAMSNRQNCSAAYCAKASIGDMTGGQSKSETGAATFGPVTDSEPLLEVIVDPGVSNLGELTTERTAFKTTTIRVRTHLSSGYILQIVGTPPKYSNHTLKTPASPTASLPGTEQFGINAVANTIPEVGADPQQIPSGQTSFGVVDDDYKSANKFMYQSGDEIARSYSESGRTDYTVSMIVNVSNSTPAGHYTGDFSAVVIPVY